MTQDAAAWFAGKTHSDLKALEVGGRVLIPDRLRRIGKDGEPVDAPVLVRVPTEGERSRARVDAVLLVAERHGKMMGNDPKMWTIERAKAVVGAEVFEDIDTYAIVARSLFEPKVSGDKPQQFMLLSVLYDSYVKSTVFDIWDRINLYADMFNPRLDTVTDEQFWGGVEAIGRVRNFTPLAVFSGSAQRNFMQRMALELWNLRTRSSSTPSPETLTSE